MASTTINSTFLLLFITLFFSSYGVVEAGVWNGIGNTVKGFLPRSGKKVLPVPGDEVFPGTRAAELALQRTGEKLAREFFGPGGEKGFRWGWKGGKYYLKVDDRCEDYLQLNCTPQAYNNPRPDCVVKCIVITATNTTVDKTPTLCYDSCDDPIEAKCTENVTHAECAKLING